MKRYIFILIVIIFYSCNDSKKANIESQKVIKKELKPFFDSDKIDHYYLNFSDDFTKLIVKDRKTEKEIEFITLFVHHFPDTIPKENFEKVLLSHNYKKSNLSLKQQKLIENVFSQKDSLQNTFASCAAEYRDIFIFKKKEKTVGVAKICFECGRFQITGSKLDTGGFGLRSELHKLKSIIRPDKKS